MIKYEEVPAPPIRRHTDVICDICGKSCNAVPPEQDLNFPSFEFAQISIPEGYWGYFSNGKDLEKHECDMCESCYDKVRDFIELSLGGKIRVERIR